MKEAEKWVQNAAAGFRRSTDPEAKLHEATTLELMTSIRLELGDLEGALKNQLTCTNALEREVGLEDERTASAQMDLAGIYQILGHEQDALRWYRRAVGTYKSKIGDRSGKVMKAEQAIKDLEKKVEIIEMN
jgi:Tfp pilus assembly protein PilF